MDDNEIIRKVMSRNPRKILNKRENYALYEAGIFGNRALTWSSYGEILKSSWKGEICMRSKIGINRKFQQNYFNIPIEKVPKSIEEWIAIGVPPELITFNQSMPDEYLSLQGEVMRFEKSLWLLYSTIKKPMNQALAEKSATINGFNAHKMLIRKLSFESYTDLEKLLSDFPTSVVEFSVYSIPVGNLAHLNRNTVFWEVRDY